MKKFYLLLTGILFCSFVLMGSCKRGAEKVQEMEEQAEEVMEEMEEAVEEVMEADTVAAPDTAEVE